MRPFLLDEYGEVPGHGSCKGVKQIGEKGVSAVRPQAARSLPRYLRARSLAACFTSARRSQYPMLVLMIGYTMLSLWILAQPIIEPTVR
jgi:hypothetical protein